jgi:hypothetical protein
VLLAVWWWWEERPHECAVCEVTFGAFRLLHLSLFDVLFFSFFLGENLIYLVLLGGFREHEDEAAARPEGTRDDFLEAS